MTKEWKTKELLLYDKYGLLLKTYTKPPTTKQLRQLKKVLKQGWHFESARHALAAKGIETGQKSTIRATPHNKLIVADVGWAETIPDWLKAEVELERLAEAMVGVSKGKAKEEVGDAEACLYLYTASLKAPMSNEFSQIYIYLTAKLMKRKNIGLADFMQEKLEKGLTIDEERELEKLKKDIYKARGGAIKHPIFEALKKGMKEKE